MTHPVVLGVGHSNKSIDQFIHLLTHAGVRTVVDVRTSPFSRWNPHFNRERLAESLEDAGIAYEWRGKNLGGLGANVLFEETISEVLGMERPAVMCSEGDEKRCHRTTILAPAFAQAGAVFWHLRWDGHLVEFMPPVEAPEGLF